MSNDFWESGWPWSMAFGERRPRTFPGTSFPIAFAFGSKGRFFGSGEPRLAILSPLGGTGGRMRESGTILRAGKYDGAAAALAAGQGQLASRGTTGARHSGPCAQGSGSNLTLRGELLMGIGIR